MAEEKQGLSLAAELARMRERAQRLEQEVRALRADLDRVIETLSRPVAEYEVDGERIVVTVADVEAVRAQLVRPHSEEAIQRLAFVRKLAEWAKKLSEEERERRFWKAVEEVRAEALEKGIAIDEPLELVVEKPGGGSRWRLNLGACVPCWIPMSSSRLC